MAAEVNMKSVYVPSQDVVAREIEDEMILVPLAEGMGDRDDQLFAFNDTGRAIWKKLDSKHSIQEIVEELSREYDADKDTVARDVIGLLGELLRRRMITELDG